MRSCPVTRASNRSARSLRDITAGRAGRASVMSALGATGRCRRGGGTTLCGCVEIVTRRRVNCEKAERTL